jgi:starvation-inducible DNA-binding protein
LTRRPVKASYALEPFPSRVRLESSGEACDDQDEVTARRRLRARAVVAHASAMMREQDEEAGMTKTTAAKETHARGAKDAYVRERLGTPTDLKPEATRDISAALAGLLADVFALYVKTKNFHWHISGPHFRDYHLLLDEQGEQIFAMTDPIAERARKIGGTSLRSIGDIARRQRILDNDAEYVDPKDMLAELREDNKSLTSELRQVHDVCDEYGDVATASLLEVWIDETERRTWFLFEATRGGPGQND